MKILVSACLLGVPCRYDGAQKPNQRVLELAQRHTLIPVCPEQLGGLPTPREPAEIMGGSVMTKAHEDRTGAFRRGAEWTAEIAEMLSCEACILRAKSPSCGVGQVYDGTFSGSLTDGNGITAQRLLALGIPVFRDDDEKITNL